MAAAIVPLALSLLKSKRQSYHTGGKVKKTGPALLKRGERVLTEKQDRKYKRITSRVSRRGSSR
jgi:hypothetical protein